MQAGIENTPEYSVIRARMMRESIIDLSKLLHHVKVDVSSFYCSGKDAKRQQARLFNPVCLLTAIGLEISV